VNWDFMVDMLRAGVGGGEDVGDDFGKDCGGERGLRRA